jgi:predicted DsbA family dithiol-disulfide isomerase
MLNPDMPSPSVNKLDYYRSRFGKRVDSMIPQMQQVGDSLGIKFSYGGQLGNTLSSHRLVSWAAKQHGHEGEDRVRLGFACLDFLPSALVYMFARCFR